jgi:hypothetical protein
MQSGMDEFARRPARDRQAFIEEAAKRRDLTPLVLEKDFWVCWTLRRLFGIAALAGSLTFKGGTSLSKAYGLIYRFSEDIDLTIGRTAPLVRDALPPIEDGISSKERQRRIEALKAAAQRFVTDLAMPLLTAEIETALGTADRWSVTLDPEDKDGQTLLFNYPKTTSYGGASENTYIKPRIKLEFGARGDTEPFETKTISPYLAEEFPDELPDAAIDLPTLAVIRTFWEKATILHALHHNEKLREGMSRHYYDTLMLASGGIAGKALADPNLLEQVVRNKSLMFADKSASYETAVLGTLRLIPSATTTEKLKQDYANMAEMFMVEPPSFGDLLAGIEELEIRLNSR